MFTESFLFLSYRSIDSDFALRFAADLKNAGIRLWMDKLDIKPGDNWGNSIKTALNQCSGLIALLSPDYFTSRYCPNELSRAYSTGRKIFPVIIRDISRTDMPIELELIQRFDFTQWRNESLYQARFREFLLSLPDSERDSVPDVETRYLNNLVAELETHLGVLEYVRLVGTVEEV